MTDKLGGVPAQLQPAGTTKEVHEFWIDINPNGRKHPDQKQITVEQLQRRSKIVELWLKRNLTQLEIAAELGISRPTVTRDIQWLLAQYNRRVLGDVSSKVSIMLMHLDMMTEELWKAWELSFENEVTETTTVVSRGKDKETRQTTTKKGRLPDSRYMDLLMKVWDRQAKILNLIGNDLGEKAESLLDLLLDGVKKSKEREKRFEESAETTVVDIDEALKDDWG